MSRRSPLAWIAPLALLALHCSPKRPAATPQSQSETGFPRGRLRSSLPSQAFPLGNFTLHWDLATAQVRITEAASPQQTLWRSVPGQAFVGMATGEPKIQSNNSGSLILTDRVPKARCDEQFLDQIIPRGDTLELHGSLAGPGCSGAFVARAKVLSERRLSFSIRVTPQNGTTSNRIYLVGGAEPDEQTFGFGEQYTVVDFKGHEVPIYVQEQGFGRGMQPLTRIINLVHFPSAGTPYTSYAPMSFYFTTKKRGLMLENDEYTVFDFKEPTSERITVHGQDIRAQFLAGNGPREILSAFTEYSGRFSPIPAWAHKGAIVGGFMHGSAQVRAFLERARRARLPLAGVFVEDWSGTRNTLLGYRLWWNWEVDETDYPDFPQLVRDIEASGAKAIAYVNPYLSDPNRREKTRQNFFAEAESKGYFVQDDRGRPYAVDMGQLEGTLIDLTNPEAYAWYKALLKRQLVSAGFKGWMSDFGESLPLDARLANGSRGFAYRSAYVEDWVRLNREVVRESGLEGEAFFFHRGAFTRSPGNSFVMWAGDQVTTWDEHDGLKSAMNALITGGLSGISANHSDIGGLVTVRLPGYSTDRSRELFFRWAEINAFSALFRTHEGFNRKDTDFELTKANDADFALFTRLANLFASFWEYRAQLLEEAARTGLPLVRHMMLVHPESPEAYKLHEQFFLGQDVFVAPVLEPGKTSVSFSLPPGRWRHLWSGQEIETSTWKPMTSGAPLGQPAVYTRVGSPLVESAISKLRQTGVL